MIEVKPSDMDKILLSSIVHYYCNNDISKTLKYFEKILNDINSNLNWNVVKYVSKNDDRYHATSKFIALQNTYRIDIITYGNLVFDIKILDENNKTYIDTHTKSESSLKKLINDFARRILGKPNLKNTMSPKRK